MCEYEIFGHRFQDVALMKEALTHPSFNGKRFTGKNYQRLEFLGDRVLGLVIAEYLFLNDTSAPEGALAIRYNDLVRRETISQIASENQFGARIRLGQSEKNTKGDIKQSILSDAMEAVIGAIYLDGGFEAAREVILQVWERKLLLAEETTKDPKSRLQEIVQSSGKEPPTYDIISRFGPDHAPIFSVAVCGDGIPKTVGKGHSRREAEQEAASRVLNQIEDEC